METKIPITETLCQYCKKQIPVGRDGKIVKHYFTFQKKPVTFRDRAGSIQSVCNGTGMKVEK